MHQQDLSRLVRDLHAEAAERWDRAEAIFSTETLTKLTEAAQALESPPACEDRRSTEGDPRMFYIVRADAAQIDLIGAFATRAAALAFAEADLGPDISWQVIGPCAGPPPVQHIAPPAAPQPQGA